MRLTVFTPTYNRKELLKRAYESLKRQTSSDFMWLIVDDGSTDNTKEAVDTFIEEAPFKIEYYYFENGGKMRAHNRGVEKCSTELFMCLDSDDYLSDTAVENLIKAYDEGIKSYDALNEYKALKEKGLNKQNNEKYNEILKQCNCELDIAGVIAHKGISKSEIFSGHSFPDIPYSTLYGLYLNGFKGETTIMFRTEVISKFPFPEIDGEKYVPEDYIYDKIDSGFQYVVVPEIITICEIVSEGYTDSVAKLKEKNKEAWYLYYEQRARITPLSLLKIKHAGFYIKFARLCNKNIFDTKLPLIYILIGLLAEKFIKK